MPGSGKSFLGETLAETLDVPFLDMDDAIELKKGKSISEIFANSGEAHFRSVESEVLRSLSNENTNAVISTGGGTPCFHNGMKFMLDNGITVFLDTEKTVLIERLERKTHRPLMQGDITGKTEKLLSTRLPIYKKAHITISHRDVSLLMDAIESLKS